MKLRQPVLLSTIVSPLELLPRETAEVVAAVLVYLYLLALGRQLEIN
ncbi:hypothetical protein [[Phormidium] sp. ETS-05]|nr:hypothetical protein [[Phormidium] sp. ETS-05]